MNTTNSNMKSNQSPPPSLPPPPPLQPSSPPLLNSQHGNQHTKIPMNFKSSEFVSKLLAATPPYLYNIPLVPQNYFFSEMLKSLVQTKYYQNGGPKLLDQINGGGGTPKKGRKRMWQDISNNNNNNNNNFVNQNNNKESKKSEPLELTKNATMNNNANGIRRQFRKPRVDVANLKINSENVKQENHSQNVDTSYEMGPPFPSFAGNGMSNSNVLAPTGGLAQQSLPQFPPGVFNDQMANKFPPFWNYWNNQNFNLQNPTIDPLHFFIDLRVSGHIYDKQSHNEINPNEPLNLQKSTAIRDNQENIENDGKSTVFENEEEEGGDKHSPDTKEDLKIKEENNNNVSKNVNTNINVHNIQEMKDKIAKNEVTTHRNSAFNVPNNGLYTDTKNALMKMDKALNNFKENTIVKNKTKTNYGINYILNNLPKIYKSFNNQDDNIVKEHQGTITNQESNDLEMQNMTKQLKYIKSYHNNLKSNKNIFTFQDNYENFAKMNENMNNTTNNQNNNSSINKHNIDMMKNVMTDNNDKNTKITHAMINDFDFSDERNIEDDDDVCVEDLDIMKNSPDSDEETNNKMKHEYVDVENSESESSEIYNM